mmetsp:Transcript_28970/g.58357  ORF Transcript_28970/g.58357 Transcript_28970/m.58357 type:complete len:345 (-) Transcript_28970:244-1278(-)
MYPCFPQGKLVHLGAADIQQAAQEFAKKSEMLLTSGEMASAHRLRAEREATDRQLELEQRQLKLISERSTAMIETLNAAEAHQSGLQKQLAAQSERRVESATQMAQLEQKAASANPSELTKLQDLVAVNDQMSHQRAEFKRQCALQLQQMNEELEALEKDQVEQASDDTQNLLEVERIHEAESTKANQMRRLVGQKGREMAALQRQLDDIPTSAELMQYERRVRELYQQVASKLEETRKYFSLYNTLEEKKGYLSKEVSLLNSIHENFTKAAAGNKDKIVESVESLLKNVQQMLQKVEQRVTDAGAGRDITQQKYDKLMEKQRKYYQLVKDYQTECQRNEQLSG